MSINTPNQFLAAPMATALARRAENALPILLVPAVAVGFYMASAPLAHVVGDAYKAFTAPHVIRAPEPAKTPTAANTPEAATPAVAAPPKAAPETATRVAPSAPEKAAPADLASDTGGASVSVKPVIVPPPVIPVPVPVPVAVPVPLAVPALRPVAPQPKPEPAPARVERLPREDAPRVTPELSPPREIAPRMPRDPLPFRHFPGNGFAGGVVGGFSPFGGRGPMPGGFGPRVPFFGGGHFGGFGGFGHFRHF